MSDGCNKGAEVNGVPPFAEARLLPRTIDDVCRQPPGSFAKFVLEQQQAQRREEDERKERIRMARRRAG